MEQCRTGDIHGHGYHRLEDTFQEKHVDGEVRHAEIEDHFEHLVLSLSSLGAKAVGEVFEMLGESLVP